MKRKERLGLLGVSALAMTAAVAPHALAQTTPAAAAASCPEGQSVQGGVCADDEIVVVGSRIRHDQFNSASPIQVINRDESIRAGLVTATDILQSNAATGGNAQINNLYGGFVTNGGNGANTLGLRGFGPTDTLILVNGRRLTPAGVRGSVGAADLNTIPTAMVQRIEILKDGASSIYGSDAVAGVVNIITNQHLDGLVFEGQRNNPESAGGEQTRLSVSGGHEFGNLSVTGSVEYYERAALTYGQRDFTRCPGDGIDASGGGEDINPNTGQPTCFTIEFPNSAGVTINTIATARRAGFAGLGANPTPVVGYNRWRPNASVGDGPGGNLDGWEAVSASCATCADAGGYFGVFGARDTFDPRMLDQELITPTRTTNAFFSAQFDLSDNVQFYGEALYSKRESVSTNFIQLSLDYPNNDLLGPLTSELRAGGVQNPTSTVPNPPPINVPLPAPYATQVRAFAGFGNLASTQNVEYTRFVAGVRGDLGFIADWRYDFNVYRGENDGVNLQPNFLTDRIFNSLVVSPAAGGEPANLVHTVNGSPVVCTITLTNPGYGCIPGPQLSAGVLNGQVPGDWLNWVLQTTRQVNHFTETAEQLVFDGPLFSLPAGQIQAVFGVEHRSQHINDTPDQVYLNNDAYNFTSGGATRGQDSVTEGFAELEFPLLRDQPFARSLTLNTSGRYTDYRSYGADSTYKVNLTWEPVDGLMFRATKGTSYRAPGLFEQFLGPTTGFLSGLQDPCHNYGALNPLSNRYINCNAQIGNTAFVQNNGITVSGGGGAATHLSAENSTNATIGFTLHPFRDEDSVGDFSFAMDWFNIELTNSITTVGAANIMNICYASAPPMTDPLCTLLARDAGNRLTVFNNYTNIANQGATGYDYGARYAHSVPVIGGRATLVANLTQYLEQPFQRLPTFSATDVNGQIGAPEMSGDLTLNYLRGPWNFRFGLQWIKAMSDEAANNFPGQGLPGLIDSTPDYFLHDASVQYSADRWDLTVGVRNMFNQQPPRVTANDTLINGFGAVPIYSGLDYYGRQFFVNVSAHF